MNPSLTAQQTAALSIARAIRLNIRLRRTVGYDTTHAIQCRLWNRATVAQIPYAMVHGALQLLD